MATDTEKTYTYEFEGSYSDEGVWSSNDEEKDDIFDQIELQSRDNNVRSQLLTTRSTPSSLQSDEQWAKKYVNDKFNKYMIWNNNGEVLPVASNRERFPVANDWKVPIVGVIYHIFSLESQEHLFMYFIDYTKFEQFVYHNWFWTPEASIITIRRHKKLPPKIYISYKLNNKEVDGLCVYTGYGKAKKHFGTKKKHIWKKLNKKTDKTIPDLVRTKYTEGKNISDLRNEWPTQ